MWSWQNAAKGIVISSLLYSQTAQAKTPILDGNFLYKSCSQPESTAEFTFCYSYIRAIYEKVFLEAAIRKPNADTPCVPQSVTYDQIKDIVTKYLSDNPKTRNGFAVFVVEDALKDAFPDCFKA